MDNRFSLVLAAEKALGELELSCTTQSDKDRCAKVRRGMVAIDEEQMSVKEAIANLIDVLDTGYSKAEVIEDLKSMVERWGRESKAALKAKEREQKAEETP